MTEHSVTIGFWLRAYDSFSIEADTEAEALEKAKAGAKTAIESAASPEYIDIEARREGIILFIDVLRQTAGSPSWRTSPSTMTASTTSAPSDQQSPQQPPARPSRR